MRKSKHDHNLSDLEPNLCEDCYIHQAVHELKDLNDFYFAKYNVNSYARWNYDQDTGKLIFSNNGVVGVSADFTIVGSVSKSSKTWLWSWANKSLNQELCAPLRKVKLFGEDRGWPKFTEASRFADEVDGWEMSAVASKILGAKGAYRCPHSSGYLFLLLMEFNFVN